MVNSSQLILSLFLFQGYNENSTPRLDTVPEVFKAFLNAGEVDLVLKRQGTGQCCKYHGDHSYTGTPLIGRFLGPRKNRLNRNPS